MRTRALAPSGVLILSSIVVAAACGHKSGGGGGGPGPKTPVGFCSTDNWCFENPIPQGEDLRAVSVLPDGTAWAAGYHVMLEYQGGVWSEEPFPQANDVYALKAFDATDVIAATDDGVFWWDGTAWTKDPTTPCLECTAIRAFSQSDLFVLDYGNTVSHWNGSSWTSEDIPGFTSGIFDALSGLSDTDLWAISDGTVAHRDASAWTTTTLTPSYTYLISVAEAAPNDVWAGAEEGIWHFDGSHWSQFENTSNYVQGMFALDPTHVFAAGEDPGLQMWNGSSWTQLDGGGGYGGMFNLAAIDMRSASDGWTVGDDGGLGHVTASGLTQVSQNVVGGGDTMTQIAAISAADAWLGDGNSNTLMHWDGSKWNNVNMTIDSPAGIWAANANDVFAGSNYTGAIAHWDGSSWTTMSSSLSQPINAMWGSSHSDVYAAVGDYTGSNGTVEHYDGSTWSEVGLFSSTSGLYSVWGSGPSDVYVVGRHGLVLHGGNGVLHEIDVGATPSQDLKAVWGSSPSSVWIAGYGVILHGNTSGGFAAETLPVTGITWNALWGTSDTDLYAVGQYGEILHRTASGWTEEKSPSDIDAYTIGGAGGQLWIGGDHSMILHKTP